jgi:sulfide dehydrogenase cytochrome subunit
MKRLTLALCLLSLTTALPFAATAASLDDIAKECDNCHGKDGNSTKGEVPNIAGMSTTYIKETLEAYRSGDRPGVKYKPENGDETDMNAIAKKLDDKTTYAISEHYAGKAFELHKQAVDAAAADKGRKLFDRDCEKCHSEQGTVAKDDVGLLLGQWKPYLEHQFKMFSDGTRTMSKKMKAKYEKLDDGEKATLIDFLARGEH